MKKSIVILVSVLFIVSALLFAEEKHCGKHEIGTDCKEKKNYALQFAVSDNFNLSSFDGATISLKKQFSEKGAIRLGLSMNFDTEDKDVDIVGYYNGESSIYTRTDKSSISYISVNSFYIFQFPKQNNLTLYYGIGPKFDYSKQNSKNNYDYENNDYIERETDLKSFGYGLSSIFGVEWNFYKNFALNAEYGLNMTYSTEKYTYTNKKIYDSETVETDKNITDGKSFRISNKPVKLGLAVYF